MVKHKFRSHLAKLIAALFTSLLSFQNAAAQDYDHFIPLDQTNVDAITMGIKPGDIVCLEAGTRTKALRLVNFQGTAAKPILVKNCGGKTIIAVPPNQDDSLFGYGLAISNSNHVRLTGSGDAAHQYGIDVSGTVMGVTVGNLSKKNIEVDHISVHDVGFAGIVVKTDPGCDPVTWRTNFPAMKNIRVHDNYVYHTLDGEGFYIGFTFSEGYKVTCNGKEITVYGHLIKKLKLYNNRTEDTGSEGIQVSSSPGAQIHHNVVIDAGVRPFADYQNNGMQISYHNTVIYNNWIENARANGLIMFGTGHHVFNNVIINAGAHGTYGDDRAKGNGVVYAHNTVISPAEDGIRLSYDETTPSVVKNNIVAEPGGQPFVAVNGSIIETSNNLFADTIAEVGFVNAAGNDYHLNSASAAVEGGTPISQRSIIFDYDDTGRPQGLSPDIGAYEWFPADGGTVTELLENGTFETPAAAGWKINAAGSGKTVCNKINRPGKPDKIVAYEESCAYQIIGKPAAPTKLIQKLTSPAVQAGDSVRFGAFVYGKQLPTTNSLRLIAEFIYTDTSKAKYIVATAAGTYDYTEAYNRFTVSKEVNKIKVHIRYAGASGIVRVDNVSLAVQTAGGLIPLPISSEGMRDN